MFIFPTSGSFILVKFQFVYLPTITVDGEMRIQPSSSDGTKTYPVNQGEAGP